MMNEKLLAVIDQLREDVAAGRLRCFAGVGLATASGEWCEVIAVPPLESDEVRMMAEGMLQLVGRMGSWSVDGSSPVEIVRVPASMLSGEDDNDGGMCECELEHDHAEDTESWH